MLIYISNTLSRHRKNYLSCIRLGAGVNISNKNIMFTFPKKSRPFSSIVNLNNGEIDRRLVRCQRMQGRLGGGGGRRQLLRAERPPAAAGTATGSGGS